MATEFSICLYEDYAYVRQTNSSKKKLKFFPHQKKKWKQEKHAKAYNILIKSIPCLMFAITCQGFHLTKIETHYHKTNNLL